MVALGDQFAFVTDRTGAMEIWVRSRDGQWERPVVTSADFGAARTDTLGALAFSPDGQHSGISAPWSGYQRVVADAGDRWSARASRAGHQRSIELPDAPSWSPDGEWVSFVRSNGPDFSLAKVRVGSSEVIQLLDRVVPFTRSAWSPDGQWIVCETVDGVVIVPGGGGTPKRIAEEPWLAYAWAPGGRRLIALD